ncbi:MAG: hypothetical protein ACW97Z_08660 [Candidatus Hodarchaeales archaeon]
MKTMKHSSKIVEIHSIRDYLKLDLHSWMVEFDVSDFGASLSTLFELPLPIYLSQAKDFFWKFIIHFFQDCSISFIQRDHQDSINLALIGHWKNKKLAIPLWIMNDTLIGFEILPDGIYSVLDSFSLNFESPFNHLTPNAKNKDFLVFDNEVYYGNTLYLKIINDSLILSDFHQIDELAFFKRIASTVLPEIDEVFHNDN